MDLRKKWILFGVVGFLAMQMAKCAFADPEDTGSEKEIIVTAERVPTQLSKITASVSVVTKKEIEKSNAKTLADVIALLPGCAVRPQGSAGALISPSLRGSDAKELLILVDGVPANDLRQGTVDLSLFPIDTISRVEVMRGPGSALYGANALGGVINIITGGASESPKYRTTFGSHDSRNYQLSTTEQMGTGNLQILADRFYTDGWQKNSQMNSWNGMLRWNLNPKQWQNLAVSLLGYRDSKGIAGPEYSPTPYDHQKDRNLQFQIQGTRAVTSSTDFTGSLYARTERLDYHSVDWQSVTTDDVHKSNSYGSQLQLTTKYKNQTLAYGLDSNYEKVASTSLVKNRWASTTGIFGQDKLQLSALDTLQVGARIDMHSEYGSQFDPRVGYLKKLSDKTILRSSIGRSFRAPTFNELYWPYTDYGYGYTYQGNPNLKPERAWSYDLGFEQKVSDSGIVKATFFRNVIHDLINPGVSRPINIGSARMQGVELEYNQRMNHFGNGFINFTSTSSKNRETSENLIRIPKETLNAGITADLPKKGSLSLISHWVGHRYDYDYTSYPVKKIQMPTYNLVDLKLMVPVKNKYNLGFGIENLFDKNYQSVSGYPMPGRTVFISFQYEP